jgi:hypothetical protein
VAPHDKEYKLFSNCLEKSLNMNGCSFQESKTEKPREGREHDLECYNITIFKYQFSITTKNSQNTNSPFKRK